LLLLAYCSAVSVRFLHAVPNNITVSLSITVGSETESTSLLEFGGFSTIGDIPINVSVVVLLLDGLNHTLVVRPFLTGFAQNLLIVAAPSSLGSLTPDLFTYADPDAANVAPRALEAVLYAVNLIDASVIVALDQITGFGQLNYSAVSPQPLVVYSLELPANVLLTLASSKSLSFSDSIPTGAYYRLVFIGSVSQTGAFGPTLVTVPMLSQPSCAGAAANCSACAKALAGTCAWCESLNLCVETIDNQTCSQSLLTQCSGSCTSYDFHACADHCNCAYCGSATFGGCFSLSNSTTKGTYCSPRTDCTKHVFGLSATAEFILIVVAIAVGTLLLLGAIATAVYCLCIKKPSGYEPL